MYAGCLLVRYFLQATEILRVEEFAKAVLGGDMIASYLHCKVDEWERFHQTVTAWEVQEYLRLY